MPPPFDAYQQAGYGQYGEYAAYGQSGMSHAPGHQTQAAFSMQQQQQQQTMGAPSVPVPQEQHHFQQSQHNSWQQPHAAYQYHPQQFVPPPTQHPGHQNHQVPSRQPQQYQQPSPLQQFASGQLHDPASQQFWQSTPQGSNYANLYQPSYGQAQPHSLPMNGQPFVPSQNRSRQPSGSSPVLATHQNLGLPAHSAGNQPRPIQQPIIPSQPQPSQPSPRVQVQQGVPSRATHVAPTSSQRTSQSFQQQGQQHQRKPSQTAGQQQTYSSQGADRSTQQSSASFAQTPQRTSHSVPHPQSTPNARVLTHVQIPSYHPETMPSTHQDRTPKRRRSNEGKPIPVNHPQRQNPPLKGAYVQIPQPPESSPLTELASSQVVPPTPSPDVDYQSVLLSLSEEYVQAAHSMSGHLCSPDATEKDLEQYHQLMATALGCLESVIVNYRPQDARKEARIRLRFAILLFEETENTIAAEESLGKGVAFCERNRLTDTKYAMQHLLVRVMYKTNPTAAIKSLEKLIQEVEAMNNTAWIYAVKLLRVSLGVQSNRKSDISTILRHLSALGGRAESHGHVGVQVAVATLDALVHLQSGDPMAVDLASRSLASARTHQLGPIMGELPQLQATMYLLDLACAFMQSSPADQTAQKLNQFHENLDAKSKTTGWSADGSFLLPLGVPCRSDVEADTGGIFQKSPTGEIALAFMWLSRSQLYMIGYMLGAFSKMNSNAEDKRGEHILIEGLKLNRPVADASSMAVRTAESINDLQYRIACSMKLLQIYAYCGRAAWPTALQAIESLRSDIARKPQVQDGHMICSMKYLTAVCKQAMGEELAALQSYQSPELSMKPNQGKTVTAIKDLQALSGLNSIAILRNMSGDPAAAEQTLADLGPYCESNPNKAIVSAYHVLRAHDPDPGMTIIKIKQCLQAALHPAQAVKNCRILTIIMNTMTAQFFDGIVGKQAVNSASAGRTLARKTQDPLWVSVGDGMYRDVLMRNGDMNGAMQAEQSVRMAMDRLPAGVKSRLTH